MKKLEDPISKSIISKASEILTDIADIGLSEVMELLNNNRSELLQEIPFIKEAVVANKIRSLIQAAAFIKKYSSFIGIIKESYLNNNDEISKLNKLFQNDKQYRNLIEYSIIEIDRYQNELKAKLLGILFTKTFKEEIFTREEYNILLFSIENIHPYTGIKRLKEFYDFEVKMIEAENDDLKKEVWGKRAHLDYSPLGNTGLLDLPRGGAYMGDLGGARINEFGVKFYEKIVRDLKNGDYFY